MRIKLWAVGWISVSVFFYHGGALAKFSSGWRQGTWGQGKWNTVGRAKVRSRKLASKTENLNPEVPPAPHINPVLSKTESTDQNSTFSFSGSIRMRVESDRKTDYLSDRTFSLLRMRSELSWKPQSNLSLFVQPQFSRAFGEPSYIGTFGTTNSVQQTSGVTYDPNLSIHQAYVKYTFTSDLEFVGGRQILSYGDELLVGALDWNNVGRSFDAFKLKSRLVGESTELFASKLMDSNVNGPGFGDKDFYGLYHRWSICPELKNLDIYSFYLSDETGNLPSSVFTVGTRLKSTVGSFDYRTEFSQQWGVQSNPHHGSQIDFEFGFTLSRSRLSFEGFYASPQFNQLFPTVHKWLGYADILGRRNIYGFGIHFSSEIADGLTSSLDYLDFNRSSSMDPAYKLNGITPLGSSIASMSKAIGSEIDLTMKYQLNPKFNLLGGGSLFKPGQYLADQLGNYHPLFYYIQAEHTF